MRLLALAIAAWLTACLPAGAAFLSRAPIPGGRISDSSSSCAHTTDSTAVQTLYYLPCVGDYLPISIDGTSIATFLIPSTSTDLSTADATYFTASTIFDFYATIESGAVTYCAVPWGTSTAGSSSRGADAGITTLLGLRVNSGTWTCYNGGSSYTLVDEEATLLGSFVISATAEDINVSFAPAAASGGTACSIGYGNIYNTQSATCVARDDKTDWTYESTTIELLDDSSGNEAEWIDPLGAYPYEAKVYCSIKSATAETAGGQSLGIGLNSTSAFSGVVGTVGVADVTNGTGAATGIAPQSSGGLNYVSALQQAYSSGIEATYYGAGATNDNQVEALILTTLY